MSESREIPLAWEWTKLGDVCDTTSGGTPSRRESKYYDGSIHWVKSGELKYNIIIDTEEKITEEAIKNSSAKIFPKGTLLIALYGATIGKLAFLGVAAATNQAVCGIYENGDINSKFLFNYLFFKRQSLVQESIGGAQPNISQSILKNLQIPLPPLPEQHRIVAKIEELFSSLDKGIESLKTAQQQLKVYRQAVLKWAFEGKLTEEWRKNNSRGDAEIAENGIGKDAGLPEGWKWVTFNDVCVKIGDIDHKMPKQVEGDGFPYLSTKDFSDDLKISFDNAKNISRVDYLNLSKKVKPEKGDIIFPRYGTIGKNVLVDFDKEFLVSYSCAIIKLNHNLVESKYVYHYSLSSKVRDEIKKYTVETTQANIGIASIKRFVFPLPKTVEEQHAIVAEIESRLSVCDKIEESIEQNLKQSEALRQSILKKAFEGKLVPQDPNDEAASVLLERIKAEREKNKSETPPRRQTGKTGTKKSQ